MLSRSRAIAVLIALAVPLPNAAFADTDQEMRGMQESIEQLQQQVETQQRQLDEQAARDAAAAAAVSTDEDVAAANDESAVPEDRKASSGLSTFLKATEFDVWGAVSYTYNTRGNGNDHIIDQNQNTGFYSDSHTFQVNQIWFRMDKAVSEESRAGFHTDIAFGEDARNANLAFGGNDSVAVFSAYVSYLLPLGYTGVRVDAGELWGMMGPEVVAAPENFNITRGFVWGLQPISHTGLIATLPIGPVTLVGGIVNAPLNDSATDSDRDKAWVGQIALDLFEDYWMAASFVHGSRIGFLEDSDVPIDPDEPDGPFFPVNNDSNETDVTIADFMVKAQPIEKLDLTLDYTYVWDHPSGGIPNTDIHGVAVAFRYALTEKLGAASRFEVIVVDPNEGKKTDEYSFTATGDYSFNDNLMVRGEIRWDWGIDGKYPKANDPYYADSFSNHQLLLAFQAIYQF